jgi:hypothetical protein
VNETAVHFARSEIDAEAAAGALRANRLHPRVARDDADGMLGGAGSGSFGRFVVLVPEHEAGTARAIMGEPVRREVEDQPLLRSALILGAIIVALIVAAWSLTRLGS